MAAADTGLPSEVQDASHSPSASSEDPSSQPQSVSADSAGLKSGDVSSGTKPPEEMITDDSTPPAEPEAPPPARDGSATPSESLPVDSDMPLAVTTPPPSQKVVSPDEGEEEEEDVAPTRLLRSAVRRVGKSAVDEEDREELVVSLSLKLIRSGCGSCEEEVKGETYSNTFLVCM